VKNSTEVKNLKSISKSEETRQRILDAAARLFRKEGYSVRLADVAEAAGVKTGSLYYHFKGRDDLVDEVLSLAMEKLGQYVQQELALLPDSATPLDRIKAAITADARMALEVSDYSAANTRIFPIISGEMRKMHYIRHQKHGELINALLEEAEAAGQLRPGLDLPIIRMLFLGAIAWTGEWYRPNRERSPESVIEQLLTMVLTGIQAPPK
jgi:TetR/AcrR family transcriptional regulator, cholesterol catabolism regulator